MAPGAKAQGFHSLLITSLLFKSQSKIALADTFPRVVPGMSENQVKPTRMTTTLPGGHFANFIFLLCGNLGHAMNELSRMPMKRCSTASLVSWDADI